jgi:hypothetical protein
MTLAVNEFATTYRCLKEFASFYDNDTYYVGTINGGGRIYQQTFIEAYSRSDSYSRPFVVTIILLASLK